MGASDLSGPVVRHPAGGSPVDAMALAEGSRERVDGEVRFDAGSRAAYSTDASAFRQTPIGVVVPRTAEAAVEAAPAAREHVAPGSAYGVAPGARPASPARRARALAPAGAGPAAAGAGAGLVRGPRAEPPRAERHSLHRRRIPEHGRADER
ncbi:hypothetical protein [Streptomyces swartbergensis]|uniref:hypothetical protein n=1 Tax=Streptomyces swartbergensis TaxID=487165 RepID=UPI003814EFBE